MQKHTEATEINRLYIILYSTVLRTVRCHCLVSNVAPLLAGLKPAPNGTQYQNRLFAQDLFLGFVIRFGALYCFMRLSQGILCIDRDRL